MLSVIHLSNNDIIGGAARAAYRIHCCMKNIEDDFSINSSMKVINKYSSDPTVSTIYRRSFFSIKKISNRITGFIISN